MSHRFDPAPPVFRCIGWDALFVWGTDRKYRPGVRARRSRNRVCLTAVGVDPRHGRSN